MPPFVLAKATADSMVRSSNFSLNSTVSDSPVLMRCGRFINLDFCNIYLLWCDKASQYGRCCQLSCILYLKASIILFFLSSINLEYSLKSHSPSGIKCIFLSSSLCVLIHSANGLFDFD